VAIAAVTVATVATAVTDSASSTAVWLLLAADPWSTAVVVAEEGAAAVAVAAVVAIAAITVATVAIVATVATAVGTVEMGKNQLGAAPITLAAAAEETKAARLRVEVRPLVARESGGTKCNNLLMDVFLCI
jgi:hypothetical protein